jgi:FkbM family methyltransferase
MVMNNQRDNVIKINAALGETPAFCSIQRVTDRNVGMHKVSGNGFIPIMTIDNMNLPVLDFLQLDVEGYEAHSLKGAEKTIARCRPVIVVEGTKADSLLQQYNYQMVERSGYADRVWIPKR